VNTMFDFAFIAALFLVAVALTVTLIALVQKP
jgi:hypothetical protein